MDSIRGPLIEKDWNVHSASLSKRSFRISMLHFALYFRYQMTKIEIADAMMQFSDEELESQRMLMWHCFSTYITPSIQSVVEFAKRVPGMFLYI